MPKKTVSKPKVTLTAWLHTSLQRVAVFHFLFAVGYALQTIVYDGSHVITPELSWWSWTAVGGLTAVAALVWYLAHNQNNDVPTYKRLTFLLVVADIAFASFNVYNQRGMASTSVILYSLAIASSAVLLSRAAVFTAAILSATAYAVTIRTYFTLNFNEGLKAQLYGSMIFYGFCFIVLAGILSALVRFGGNSSNS